MTEALAEGETRRRRLALWVLLGSTVVYGLALPLAVALLLMSPFLFVSAPHGDSPAAWAYLGGALGYLVLAVATVVTGWVLFRLRRYRMAVAVQVVPLLATPLAAALTQRVFGR